jgi:hypothetical protein
VRAAPKWHLREITRVLVEEDFGDGGYPMHKDIKSVADILRIGEAALAMRFREVDPAIWTWLFEELKARDIA